MFSAVTAAWAALILSVSPETAGLLARDLGAENTLPVFTEVKLRVIAFTENASETGFSLEPVRGFLLERLTAAERLLAAGLMRLKASLALLACAAVIMLASVYDGLVVRRIRSITQRAPRPMLSLKAAHAALILGFTALNVFFLPLVGAEFWAFAVLLAAAVLMNVWVREFHRFK
ncbi:hypothetical protein [Duodenibacillus massiliensis]|uniref:hypothetical protein n=1 Tax=Duodenibacillus massiliensis TaxID=1852381 RepID=UPI00307923E7